MDLSFITNYFVPVVMAGCLATGYVVKKWINITVETVVGGAICGLASTGLHQAFTRLIENKEN